MDRGSRDEHVRGLLIASRRGREGVSSAAELLIERLKHEICRRLRSSTLMATAEHVRPRVRLAMHIHGLYTCCVVALIHRHACHYALAD